jgi:hypothetical protein
MFYNTLKADVTLLQTLNIMDYSLLVRWCFSFEFVFIFFVSISFSVACRIPQNGLLIFRPLLPKNSFSTNCFYAVRFVVWVSKRQQIGVHDASIAEIDPLRSPGAQGRRSSGVVLTQQVRYGMVVVNLTSFNYILVFVCLVVLLPLPLLSKFLYI